MRLNDIASGLMLLGVSVLIWFGAASLPNPASQVYGPAFFPKIIAVAMGVSSIALIATSLSQLRSVPILSFDDWIRDPLRIFQFLLVPATVIFYVYSVEEIGFLFSAAIVLTVLQISLRVRVLSAAVVSAVVVAFIYAIFDLFLRVPLPRGDMFYG